MRERYPLSIVFVILVVLVLALLATVVAAAEPVRLGPLSNLAIDALDLNAGDAGRVAASRFAG